MGKSLTERLKNAVTVGRSRSPSPEPGPSNLQAARQTWSSGTDTPFKDFLLSYLTDSTQQRLFAFTFADQIHHDRNALVIDLEDVYIWLGHARRDHAVRHLKSDFSDGDFVYIAGVPTSGDDRDQRDRYLISISMFKKLLLSSRSQQGRDYRDLIITIEGAAYDYMKIEMEKARRLIETHKSELEEQKDRTADLAKQVEDLRLSKITFWLYAYRLFENRYKCGFTTDIEARIKQHRTSCPSGYLSHKVTVHSKALEKVMDSVLKAHGNHITQEEYVFDGGDDQVRLVLNTIARVEESLHVVPFERYDVLLDTINRIIDGVESPHQIVFSGPPSRPRRNSHGHGDVQPVTLHNIDHWLIHMVEKNDLPSGIISGTNLLGGYNDWLQTFDPDMPLIHSKNFLYPNLRPYFGCGIRYDTSPGRPAYYRFDKSALLRTLVSSKKYTKSSTTLSDYNTTT